MTTWGPQYIGIESANTGLYISAAELVPSIGNSVLAVTPQPKGLIHRILDATNQLELSAHFSTPYWWSSIYIDLLWFNLSTTGLNVRLRASVGTVPIGSGVPVTPQQGTDFVGAASTTQYSIVRTTIGSFAVSPLNYTNVRVGRIGTSSTDTKIDDIGLMGIEIRQANP